jgi:hypothetical protein
VDAPAIWRIHSANWAWPVVERCTPSDEIHRERSIPEAALAAFQSAMVRFDQRLRASSRAALAAA